MAFTTDVTTNIGKVRLLIADIDPANPVYQDAAIDAFLGMENGVKRAAALALETIASNEAQVLKVIKLLQLTVDGAKTSDAILKRAAMLRAQAAADDDMPDGNATFDIVEWSVNDFAAREIRRNAYRRNAG